MGRGHFRITPRGYTPPEGTPWPVPRLRPSNLRTRLTPSQPVVKPTRRSAGDASRPNHSASLRSSLRFSRNTPGIPPSRASSAGRLAPTGRTGRPRRSREFHHRLLTGTIGNLCFLPQTGPTSTSEPQVASDVGDRSPLRFGRPGGQPLLAAGRGMRATRRGAGAGAASGYPPRRNGSTPAAPAPRRPTGGATISIPRC